MAKGDRTSGRRLIVHIIVRIRMVGRAVRIAADPALADDRRTFTADSAAGIDALAAVAADSG